MNYKEIKKTLRQFLFVKLRKNIQLWIYYSCTIDLFAVSLVIPVFGAHLRRLGLSHSLIGIVSSAYSVTQLLSGPVAGSWSDTYGRKSILVLTLLISSVFYFFLGIVNSFVLIFSTRIILGSIKHTQTICKALVADFVPVEKQAETHGKLNAISSLGFMAGPIIGGHVSELENGFFYICAVASMLFLLNSLTVYWLFPEISTSSDKKDNIKQLKKSSVLSGIYQIVNNLMVIDWTHFWDVFLLKFLVAISSSFFFTNYYFFVETSFNISPKYIGYTISFHGMVSALLGAQVGRLHKLYNVKSSYYLRICHIMLLLTFSFLGIYFSPNIFLFVACLLPLSGSMSLLRTLTTELLLHRTSADQRGSLMGASNSANSSARLIAPLITGFAQEYFDTSKIIIFASLLSFAGAVLCATLNKVKSTDVANKYTNEKKVK